MTDFKYKEDYCKGCVPESCPVDCPGLSLPSKEDKLNCNHHHTIEANQSVVDFGTGKFIADNGMIPLLKALNEAGLITRTHHGGPNHSFVAILMRNNLRIEFRPAYENACDRGFDGSETELLLSWDSKETQRAVSTLTAPHPKGEKEPPTPPPGPPGRSYRDFLFLGLVETKESKQKSHDYDIFMQGYWAGRDSK